MKGKANKKGWPIVAICYDFDKTLSPKDMQDYSLLPKLNCSAAEFWPQSNALAREQGMDKILSYMHLIITKARAKDVRITQKDFRAMGKEIELFRGVDTWFDRIDAIAESLRVNVEHYIISAGLKEIVEGTPIARYFTEIYASSFVYSKYGEPIWPRQVVNYTTKTQYLFRISKNCLDLGDEDSVNEYIGDDERRIPFRNFIYIGDSETDIPAMKIVKNGGGTSIGVYNAESGSLDRVRKLLEQKRIDYLLPADYGQGSRLERVVSDIIRKIDADENLNRLNRVQSAYVRELEEIEYLEKYTKTFLENNELSEEEAENIERQAQDILRRAKRRLHQYEEFAPNVTNDRFIAEVSEKVMRLFDSAHDRGKERGENG